MDPIAAGVGFLHFAIGKTFHLSRWWKEHLRTDDKCLDFEKNLVCRVYPAKGPEKKFCAICRPRLDPVQSDFPFHASIQPVQLVKPGWKESSAAF